MRREVGAGDRHPRAFFYRCCDGQNFLAVTVSGADFAAHSLAY